MVTEPEGGIVTILAYCPCGGSIEADADYVEDSDGFWHASCYYTDQAVQAVSAAARNEHDFGGWLSLVLVRAAAQLGSLDALTAGRPGSWEAGLVDQLARGLAFDDEGLAYYRAPGGIP